MYSLCWPAWLLLRVRPRLSFTMPLLMFSSVYCAMAVARLIEPLVRSPLTAAIVATTATATGLLHLPAWEMVSCLQVLGSALTFTLMAEFIGSRSHNFTRRRVEIVKRLLRLLLPLTALFFVYPQMAFLAMPVLLGVVFVSRLSIGLSRASKSTTEALLLLALSLVLSLLVIPTRVMDSITRLVKLGDVVAGWTLPAVTVQETFGLAKFPSSPPTPPQTVATVRERVTDILAHPEQLPRSWLILLLLVGGLVVLHLSRLFTLDSQTLVALSYIALPGASYVLFLARYGPGYQQWKWLSTWSPLIVAATLGLLVHVLERHVSKTRLGTEAVSVVAVTFVVLIAALSGLGATAFPHRVSPALPAAAARDLPAELNVDVTDSPTVYWDTMLVAFYLPRKHLYLNSPSYYSPTSRREVPTLRWDGKNALELDSASPFIGPQAHS